MPTSFNAAKDLVYTISGNTISSGGYRISKILNGKSKKKGKQEGGGGNKLNIYNEDSGIPVGLLLLQRLHVEPEHRDNDNKDKNKDANDFDTTKIDTNKKLVYASIMENNDDEEGDNKSENIELVIMPSSIGGLTHTNCYSENPIEIFSNEIDDELYDSLIKRVSESGHQPNAVTMVEMTPLRKTSTTKKQHFGKHKDVEKVFQKRRTRSKRRSD